MSSRQLASRPRSICSKRKREEFCGGGRSTPTTRDSSRKGSSLVPRFPETPVTRTLRFTAMISEAQILSLTLEEPAFHSHQSEAAAAEQPERPDAAARRDE